MAFSTTQATVAFMPDCDFHKMHGESVPARFDGKTHSGPWANMCDDCFERNGVGLGLGKGQELVLFDAVTDTPDRDEGKAQRVQEALDSGDPDAVFEAVGDGDLADYL
jgi:hypothetical protein